MRRSPCRSLTLSPSDDAAVGGAGGRRRSQLRREAPGHETAAHASGDGGAGPVDGETAGTGAVRNVNWTLGEG